MVFTMTVDHLVSTYADANGVAPQDARQKITDCVDEPFEELPNQVRIILVSQDFSTETVHPRPPSAHGTPPRGEAPAMKR
jgi:hypothetical protein